MSVSTTQQSGSATIRLRSITGPNTNITDYLVSGPGIPDETYIASSNVVGDELEITLEDKNGQNVFVSVTAKDLTANPPITESDVITWTPTDGISSNYALSRPGIQYLAVYETEPTKSAIDIFWETASSGLISDLNALIVNSQSDPGGLRIGPWTTNVFNEGLAKSGNILSSPFNLLDEFGAVITLSGNDSLVIHDVLDGDGNSVNQNPFTDSTNIRDYFRLVDTGSGYGPWQIRTTEPNDMPTAASSAPYWPNVYYFSDNPNTPGTNNLRNFKFIFKVEQNTTDAQGNPILLETFPGQSGEIYEAVLGNVAPIVYKITTEQPAVNPDEIYGVFNNTPIPDPIEIDTNREEQVILKELVFTNGAANEDITYNNDYLSNKDVELISSDGTGIFSQTIASTGAPAEVNGQPIFEIQDYTGTFSYPFTVQKMLVNTQWQNNNVPAEVYNLQIRIQDGANTTVVNLLVDMSTTVQPSWILNRTLYARAVEKITGFQAINGNKDQHYNVNGFPGGQNAYDGPKGSFNFPCTVIDVPANSPGFGGDEDGRYLYAGGFFNTTLQPVFDRNPGSRSLVNYSGGTGSVITLPRNTPDANGNQVQTNNGSGLLNSISGYPPFVKGYAYVIDKITNPLTGQVLALIIGDENGTVQNPGSPTGFNDPNYAGDNGVPGFWKDRFGPLSTGMRCYVGDWDEDIYYCDNGQIPCVSNNINCGCIGLRFPERVLSYNPTTGRLDFQSDNLGPMIPNCNIGDKLHFFNGKKTSQSNPWFHGRTNREVLGLYMWSEWGPGFWDDYANPINKTTVQPGSPANSWERVGFGEPSSLPSQPHNMNDGNADAYHSVPGQPPFDVGDYQFSLI